MLVLVQLLMMMMMVMKSEAASGEIITVSARSGETALLPPDQQRGRMEHRWDVRWTHLHLMLSLTSNMTTGHHGRCELLSDGSLRFSPVHTQDSGKYTMQVFDQSGKRVMKREFLLRVEESRHTDNTPLISCLLLLPLLPFIIILFILRRRRRRRRIQRTTAAGPGAMEESVYVSMHGHHGNEAKVSCHPAVSMETSITQQMPEEEDIYV
ncbi:uncharacterized protein LOC121191174 isoform X2 [Toxotes jaculatrix]|uniref:uncharacterized protein LOC121191174 isoform X2 n=1 Tax=Toxotes jaculatrix TaxID=941984 RepID=UPI001B3B09EF|nr:uncharacterized protein LOC121191174 isoform X2 [Toxotes jaculatrix]